MKVEIPFTEQEIDTSDDASSIGLTVLAVIIGFALFAWLRDVGQTLANQANSYISGLVGIDPTSGENASNGGAFD